MVRVRVRVMARVRVSAGARLRVVGFRVRVRARASATSLEQHVSIGEDAVVQVGCVLPHARLGPCGPLGLPRLR